MLKFRFVEECSSTLLLSFNKLGLNNGLRQLGLNSVPIVSQNFMIGEKSVWYLSIKHGYML